MTNQELEKIFDNNCNRMTKHHGNAMSKEKFVEVVSELIEEKKELGEIGAELINKILAIKPTDEIGYFQEAIKIGINKLKQ